jgi:hypothetical protein
LRFTLLNSIIFNSIIGQSLLKFYHLFIKVLFNISVILKEFLVDVSVGRGHLALVVLDHFFELVSKLTICFVESDLDSVLKRWFINSHFVFKVLETLSESCFDYLELFSDKRRPIFGIFFNFIDILWKKSDILHYLILFRHQILSQITSILFLLFKILLCLWFNITYLRINILFKSRNNLFKPTEFRINCFISCGHAFNHDCLNFL